MNHRRKFLSGRAPSNHFLQTFTRHKHTYRRMCTCTSRHLFTYSLLLAEKPHRNYRQQQRDEEQSMWHWSISATATDRATAHATPPPTSGCDVTPTRIRTRPPQQLTGTDWMRCWGNWRMWIRARPLVNCPSNYTDICSEWKTVATIINDSA